MKNVKHALCSVCKAYASFGYRKNRPLCCFQHQEANMKNVKATVCAFEGCTANKPKYGNGVVGRAYCELHYDPMEHWKVTTCVAKLCKTVATHSDNAKIPFVFCNSHAPDTFSAASTNLCQNCGTKALCDVDGICYHRCQQRKTTEKQLKDFLVSQQFTFLYNRCVPGSNKRPDFLFFTPFGYVVLENDEHRHLKIKQHKEQARMKEIQSAFQTSVHFIRFNPDLTATHVEPLETRHFVLKNYLQSVLCQADMFFQQHPELTVHYLFY